MTSTRDLQREIIAHKQRMGFNTTSHDREISLALVELGELHQAIDKGLADEVGGELADVAVYLLTLAEMNGLDLGEEVVKKMAVNKGRRYRQGPGGAPVRVT